LREMQQPNLRLLANQISRQWWDRWSRRPRAAICGSPTAWAKYTEALYLST